MKYTIFNQNGKFGVEDDAGNNIIPPIYTAIRECTSMYMKRDVHGNMQWYKEGEIRFAVKKGKLWALSNERHQLLTPFKYNEIENMHGKIMPVKIDKKLGIIDSMGKELVPVEYDDFWNMGQPIFCAIKDKLYGYLNHNGDIVIPIIYEKMGILFAEDLVAVQQNKKVGFMDMQGNLVIPYMYDGMTPRFQNGFSTVRKGKDFGLINKNNDIILPFFKLSIFSVVHDFWKKNHKLSFSDLEMLLHEQKYKEAEAFLLTIQHFQQENYTQYFEFNKEDINTALLLIDMNHKMSKKLLLLLGKFPK